MPGNLSSLLFARVDRGPDGIAYHWHERGAWQHRTWRESIDSIARIARLLADLGVTRGVPVAVISDTRPEWTAIDLANQCLGAITVGVYPSLLADAVRFQLAHSRARVAIVEDASQYAKIAAMRADLPDLKHIVSIEAVDGLPRLEDQAVAADVPWLRAQAEAIPADAIATYIYTSGTTGEPKAAILTHANFWEVAHATRAIARIEPADRGVVFLPLAHSLQRFTIYRALIDDVIAVYATSIDELPDALAFGRPTVLASVPRMLEKIKDKAEQAASARGPRARSIFDWAVRVGRTRVLALEANGRMGIVDRVRWRIADRLVFRKIRDRLGGELRVLVCGGARLDPDVARFFIGAGILVLEGWGLTETTAPATGNREDAIRIGTVGLPLPGVALRLAEDGELSVRGPGIFAGYLNDPAATKAAFVDGWFCTGDIGTIDADGFVTITDRKKEILITAGGKNIPPVNIEKRIERSSAVSQAIAIGDGRPYLTALIAPDPEARARLGEAATRAAIALAVDQANASLAKFEQIKRFEIVDEPFSIESGELTPTLKLKRRVIAERRAEAIERMYHESSGPPVAR